MVVEGKLVKRKILDRAQKLACMCFTGAIRSYFTPLHLEIVTVDPEAILRMSKKGAVIRELQIRESGPF